MDYKQKIRTNKANCSKINLTLFLHTDVLRWEWCLKIDVLCHKNGYPCHNMSSRDLT